MMDYEQNSEEIVDGQNAAFLFAEEQMHFDDEKELFKRGGSAVDFIEYLTDNLHVLVEIMQMLSISGGDAARKIKEDFINKQVEFRLKK